ncbi:uncharacterized protein EI97DRAFT_29145 [Westerdykella ornata]|uniref:Uncharacterized protein n=1 Tax=Westerdykella ornata TaxID=318751 RepID=A0A6A6JXS9_WESOR|nr:uncharacterized protein EI97DRAFT_29145 [Westerdykella ornata]KAF2281430.1 hypothetical protein EI97DRAFT_29145 [Westerdykella ornata]
MGDGDRDEKPASPTSGEGVSGPAPPDVSKPDKQPHDASMERQFASPNILCGATNGDNSDAGTARTGIEPELTEVQRKEGVVQQPEFEEFQQEQGIIKTLYEASSQNFRALLKLAKASRSPRASKGIDPEITVKNPGSMELSSSSNLAELSQIESLQRDFIRFNVWGEEFDVAGGKLDEELQYAEELKEDLIVVLLHLCDALYHGRSYFTTRPDMAGGTE